jgi:radical SAM protein with 4Fe4S-binding SPASM domain
VENTNFKAQFNYDNRIDLAKNVPIDNPLVVYVEPSSYCNLECRFCPQHTGKGEFPKYNMSVDIFKKILSDIGNFKVKPSLMRFCGIGDPLFNKNIAELIRLADQANIVQRTEVITNGILLNDEIINSFAKHLGRIVVSVEGLSNEDYKNFALRKVDFDKFVHKIKQLYDFPGRKCIVHIKIHNQAVLDINRKKRFFEIFTPISDEIYIENLVDLWPEKKSNLGVNNGHRFVSDPIRESLVCPQIFKSLQVNADGRVLPCCVDWKSINIVGDINENSLLDIWNGKPLMNLRVKHLHGKRYDFSPCKGCNHNEYSEQDNLDDYKDVILEKIINK